MKHLHLGLGNFFRAHQAWYSQHAPDGGDWPISAFAGRSPALADALTAAGNRYELVTRAEQGDRVETIDRVVAAHHADDPAWARLFAEPKLAIVTLTVTERGYRRDADGHLDVDDRDVLADRAALSERRPERCVTVPGRLAAGLLARRDADAGPLAIVPCDNVPANGAATRTVVRALASELPGLAEWLDEHVSFVDTVVDRITPRGPDPLTVVTEPFSEWILAGEFPAGRPDWVAAGARLVRDATPYEQRKLRLLNGAHSLLAYVGSALGHHTVADAIADPRCAEPVEQWWDEAASDGSLADAEAYRAALLRRFANPGIRHTLAQVAEDGREKLRVRVVPTLTRLRAEGAVPPGAVAIVAAWARHEGLAPGEALEALEPGLGDDAELVEAVRLG